MEQSPFDNLINIIGGLSQGSEKPMKHGFYNAFALFLITVCCAALYVLFLILEPFFKPLFWALLVGSLLFPFKLSLSKKLKHWFDNLEQQKQSVLYGFAVIPINCVNGISDYLGEFVKDHYKSILSVIGAIFLLPWMYNVLPKSLLCFMLKASNFVAGSVATLIGLLNVYIMFTLSLGYGICIYFMWTPERDLHFRQASLFVWIILSAFVSGFAGQLSAYVFIVLQILAISGFVLEVIEVHKQLSENSDEDVSILTSISYVINNKTPEQKSPNPEKQPDNDSTPFETPVDTIDASATPRSQMPNIIIKSRKIYKQYTIASIPMTRYRKSSLSDTFKCNFKNTEEESSVIYFKVLFFLWFCMIVWKQLWLLPVVMLFLMIYMLKMICGCFGVTEFLNEKTRLVKDAVYGWCETRYFAVIPAHMRGVLKLINYCNVKLRMAAYESVDTVSSATVIVALIMFVLFAFVFLCVQIYSETIIAVQYGSNILNSTMIKNSELKNMLPEGWEDTLDSVLDNAYTYGREGISNVVKSVLKDGDSEKVSKVEQQILELWDRVYQSWMASGHPAVVGPSVDYHAVQTTWEKFVGDFLHTPGLLDYTRLVEWLKSNTGTLTAIAGGIWAPLASNVSLLTSSIITFASLLFCGGSAIVNFVFSSIIFFTTLFYLLTCSDNVYKPVEVMTQTLPSIGPKLGNALTMAINQVFKASIKMAVFYGVWTWLINNAFGAHFVYLPAAFAAILGAIPFLGTWIACIPAVLDIWLAQGRPISALLLAIAQFLPTSLLDVTVYKEISNGGHPYLTGLAIAGGIFYLGVEGAILGPLLLCCLMLVFNLSSAFMRETPLEERTRMSGDIVPSSSAISQTE